MNCFFTIVSNNYLHFARTLLKSVRNHYPSAHLYCVIVDEDMSFSRDRDSEFTAVNLRELGLPYGDGFLFQYTVLELNTAVKPWAFEYLFNLGHREVIYLDPDIFVYAPLVEVAKSFACGGEIVLTPHLTRRLTDDRSPTELDIRRAGTYNFGFCALKKSDNSVEFLKWWQSKLERECIVDPDRGIFVDQSWIDLVPGLFENVAIIRHEGYNVAYWNIAQRAITKDRNGNFVVNDKYPLVFFHFSGFNPKEPERFSKHQNRFRTPDLSLEAQEIIHNYVSAVLGCGYEVYSKCKYGFGSFADGTTIPDSLRTLYRTSHPVRAAFGDHPFSSVHTLTYPSSELGLTKAQLPLGMYCIWSARPDLRDAFPINESEASLAEFYNWFSAECLNIYGRSSDQLGLFGPESVSSEYSHISAGVRTLVSAAGLRRLSVIYQQLLNRDPDPIAVEVYAHRCATLPGALRVSWSVLRSKEGKSRHLSPGQLLRAMNALIAVKVIDEHSDAHIATRLNIRAPRGTSRSSCSNNGGIRAITGIFGHEGDSKVAGLWCGPTISIPIPRGVRPTNIKLTGKVFSTYYAESDEPPPQQILRLLVNGCEVSRHVIDTEKSSDFSWHKDLSVLSFAPDSHIELNFTRSFVPADKGLGNDRRLLSVRIKSLYLNELELVDSSLSEPIADIQKFEAPPGVNLVGYVTSEHGVGEASRRLAWALQAARVPVHLIDVGYQAPTPKMDKSILALSTPQRNPLDIIYVNADQTLSTISYLGEKGHRSAARIGFWHWEQESLPKKFLPSFDGLLEVWTPTSFVQKAVSEISPVPVFCVPHSVDVSGRSQKCREDFGLPPDKFLVLLMYDFDSYQFRKNPQASVRAFRSAFSSNNDAGIVIKTSNAARHPQAASELMELCADIPNVYFIDSIMSKPDLLALQDSCDCLISLHRAEGFGFAIAEMMALGKPVVATGWSGNMDFMTTRNSLPVSYDLLPLQENLGPYVAGLNWAEADTEHAAELLRRIFDDSHFRASIGDRAAHDIQAQLSPETIGSRCALRLKLLSSRI